MLEISLRGTKLLCMFHCKVFWTVLISLQRVIGSTNKPIVSAGTWQRRPSQGRGRSQEQHTLMLHLLTSKPRSGCSSLWSVCGSEGVPRLWCSHVWAYIEKHALCVSLWPFFEMSKVTCVYDDLNRRQITAKLLEIHSESVQSWAGRLLKTALEHSSAVCLSRSLQLRFRAQVSGWLWSALIPGQHKQCRLVWSCFQPAEDTRAFCFWHN